MAARRRAEERWRMGELAERRVMAQVVEAVAKRLSVSPSAIRGPRRVASVSRARAVAQYLIRTITGASYPEIGRHFGRDHTTVLMACRRIEREASEDDRMARLIEGLTADLRPKKREPEGETETTDPLGDRMRMIADELRRDR